MKARRPNPHQMRQMFRVVIATFLLCGALSMGSLVGVMSRTFHPKKVERIDPETGEKIYVGSAQAINPWDIIRPFNTLNRKINILILGSDYNYIGAKKIDERQGGARTRTDTIMLASLDPSTHKISLMSIPRDTYALLTGYHYDKINAAMTYGGIDLVKSTITDLTGIPIDYYMGLKVDGLVNIIDLLDGIRIYVEKDMHYVDETAHLGINIHKGWKEAMNGEQANQYVRFRKDELGDIGRVQRQQKFVRAVVDKMMQPQSWLKIPALLDHLNDNIETDIPSEIIGQMIRFGTSIKKEDVHMVMLPGTFSTINGISFWRMNTLQAREVIADLFPESSLNLAFENKATIEDSNPYSHYRVSVWNATGDLRTGREVLRRLRKNGWPIYSVRKAPHDTPITRYIAQNGNTKLLNDLARTIGMAEGEKVTASIGELGSDFTILIGPDLVKYYNSLMTEEEWVEADKQTMDPGVTYRGNKYSAPELPATPIHTSTKVRTRKLPRESALPDLSGNSAMGNLLEEVKVKPELPSSAQHSRDSSRLATPAPMIPAETEINQVDPLYD